MLQLKNIVKNYYAGEQTVQALKNVSINFRESEFVAILGASGCGKTTLLNIVGGLDRYTEGDLIINGISTKHYRDGDWDAYRNHSIGFVFQSYNLISHQTVLRNVELALTLSGVKGEEKRSRAINALEQVGLGDQINKRPNQLSGGQMQRVAIARAIVNNPDIILADEPTGALDTTTSVQVMEILKELSKSKLVIMVTHNPELAEKYSTRTINLSDGNVVGDSAPFDDAEAEAFGAEALKQSIAQEAKNKAEGKPRKKKKPSMSFFTALSLSLNNLKTKFMRTFLTAFAGSFGIIGIALILSLSNGFNGYVQDIQRDTLTNYPITISKTNFDYTSALTAFMGTTERDAEKYPDTNTITSQNTIDSMLTNIVDGLQTNDIKSFKPYLEENIDRSMISSIQYSYNMNLSIYTKVEDAQRMVSPIELPPISQIPMDSYVQEMFSPFYKQFEGIMNRQRVFAEMIDNRALIEQQYNLLHGEYPNPENENEALLVVDEYNQLDDMTLYMLGVMNDKDIMFIFTKLSIKMQDDLQAAMDSNHIKLTEAELVAKTEEKLGYARSNMSYTFDELLKLNYTVLLPSEKYEKDGNSTEILGQSFQKYKSKSETDLNAYIESDNSSKLKITGIVRLKEGVSTGALNGVVCYQNKLTNKLIAKNNLQDIVKDHIAEKEKGALRAASAAAAAAGVPNSAASYTFNVLTGYPCGFNAIKDKDDETKWDDSYDTMTSLLGISYEDDPTDIAIYPSSFDNKSYVEDFIKEYNNTHSEKENIKYTDMVGLLMSSITTIINAVSYVLIAFVSISLIVSSIMIGVITYISVLERTKEIGILRSIGASKRDIRRVFNAETGIIGLTAGVLGVAIALLLTIPINIIILSLSGLSGVAALPIWGGVGLILISVTLTLISGLLPANTASKKDPVVALRTD